MAGVYDSKGHSKSIPQRQTSLWVSCQLGNQTLAYEKTVDFIDSWRCMVCMVGANSGSFVPTKPSVAKQYPEILHEWNDDLDPNKISLGSGKKIKWKCKEGHEWESDPSFRFRNYRIKKCPEC